MRALFTGVTRVADSPSCSHFLRVFFFLLLFIFKSALSESHHQRAVLSAGAWAYSTEAGVPRGFRGLSMALMRLDTPVRLSETDPFFSGPFPRARAHTWCGPY